MITRCANFAIVTNLLEPRTKSGPSKVIKTNGLKTTDKYPKDDFIFAYTDGSSEETFLKGGLGVFITTPSDATYQRVIDAGTIISCFICELRVIIEALDVYETLAILEQAKGLVIFCDSKAALHAILNRGSWITQGICSRRFRLQELDKVFSSNSYLHMLTLQMKEARNLNNGNFVNVTLLDANAVANFKLREKSIPVKHQICNISGDRLITKTIARLRIGIYRVIKIDRDDGRTYRNCGNCLDTELTPAYMFDGPAIFAALQKIWVLFSSTNLYVDNIEQIAGTIIWDQWRIQGGWGEGNPLFFRLMVVVSISREVSIKQFQIYDRCQGIFDVKDAPRTGDKIIEIIEVDRHVSSRSITQELKIDHKTALNHLRKVGSKKNPDVCHTN
ncbi:RNase H domain-containing protein [Trichonephila clavipes]|nr:RNase H domain-containing protein [Trichonephila clavipes]